MSGGSTSEARDHGRLISGDRSVATASLASETSSPKIKRDPSILLQPLDASTTASPVLQMIPAARDFVSKSDCDPLLEDQSEGQRLHQLHSASAGGNSCSGQEEKDVTLSSLSSDFATATAAAAAATSASPAAAGASDSESGAGSEGHSSEESLKMFVGQIPRDWTEEECRQLFSPFGCRITCINVLRDKKTGISRGESASTRLLAHLPTCAVPASPSARTRARA